MKDKEIEERVRTMHSFLYKNLKVDSEKSFDRKLALKGHVLGFMFSEKLKNQLLGRGKRQGWRTRDDDSTDDLVYFEGMRLRNAGLTPSDSCLHGRPRAVLDRLWSLWSDAWGRGYWDYTWFLEESVRRGVSLNAGFVGYDEANDFSELMFKVTGVTKANRIVIASDPDQAIYTWNGSAPMHVFTLPFDTVINQPKSWRVPSTIAAYADKALDGVKERSKTRMESVRDGGIISHETSLRKILSHIKDTDALVLARANYQVEQLEKIGIKEFGLNVDKSIDLRGAVRLIEARKSRLEYEDKRALLTLPTRFFKHGGKERLEAFRGGVSFLELEEYIVGEELMDALRSGSLAFLDDEVIFHTFDKEKPEVRFMTMHDSKSLEADNVVLFNKATRKIEDEGNPDDETRLYYVGITRAKEVLYECDTV